MPVKHNGPQFTARFVRLKNSIRPITEKLVASTAVTVRDAWREEIPPPKQGAWAAASSYPDIAEGTGKLKTAIVASKPQSTQGGFSAKVYIVGARNNMVARVHENGMVIRAKTPRGMVFVDARTGQVIVAQVVRIRAKHHFELGVTEGFNRAKDKLQSDFDAELRRAWK